MQQYNDVACLAKMPLKSRSTKSSFLSYLPAFFYDQQLQSSDDNGSIDINSILLIFEEILGELEETTNNLPTVFYPLSQEQRSGIPFSSDLTEWLAGWAAISLREDWTPAKKQNLLKNVIPLYRSKGTKDNLIELLKIYAEYATDIKVIEPEDKPFRILKKGDPNGICLGKGNRIGGAPPFYFEVEITLPRHDSTELVEGEFLKLQREAVKAVIDLNKPAHTEYKLKVNSETIQIGNRSRSVIGKSMLIGNLKKYTSPPARIPLQNPFAVSAT
jgi:phage tail-like protein